MKRIYSYFFQDDREFFRNVIRIALPISLQSLIQSSLTMIDQLMIGQLGEQSIAAIGIGSKPWFIMFYTLSALAGGAAIFSSQFWGRGKDSKHLGQVLGSSFLFGIVIVGVAVIFSAVVPALTLSLFSHDAKVISIGTPFLRIISITYLPTLIILVFSSVLRSTDQVKIPMYAGLLSVVVNTLLNLLLINGNCGFPALGVTGAAVATVTARTLECAVLLGIMYYKKMPAAVSLANMFRIRKNFFVRYLSVTLPLIATNLIWVVGDSMFSVIYGRMSTDALAAMVMSFPIQGMTIGFFVGLSTASCVLLGNLLGDNRFETARLHAKKYLLTALSLTLLMGVSVALLAPVYVSFFKVSQAVFNYAITILVIFGLMLWIKVLNMVIGEGVLRSGGDTRFWMYTNIVGMWCVGIPAGFVAAFWFKLPIHLVYIILFSEEIVKCIMGLYRIASRKWINNVVGSIHS